VSNRLKLKGSRPPLPHCGACGRPVPKGMVRHDLPDGRVVCTRCIDAGSLFQRLPCGHMAVSGMRIYADSADMQNFQCMRCAQMYGS
jgi:recombinational DNA repair protein (RecF pathway)